MPSQKDHDLQTLTSLLSPSELLHPEDLTFAEESASFSYQKNLHPKLVIRPSTTASLSRAIKFLASSTLNFQVRNGGCGSASASDVLISMRAFTDFHFDREKEIVELGAGCLWGEYYERMDVDYTVVACRTPFIGVAGSILAGGYSWLSGDFGCTSDKENFLDAEIVLLDGRVIWASEEPEVLWGLRGGQVGLGVVTKFKLRAFKYPSQVWGGPILIPMDRQKDIARGIASLDAAGKNHPKVAMFLYALHGPNEKLFGGSSSSLVVHAFDGNGEAHGREKFKWALEIPGAVDQTKLTTLKGMSELQGQAKAMHGKASYWWNPLAVPLMTEGVIERAFEWWRRTGEVKGSGRDYGSVLFELFSVCPSSDPAASAWPRPRNYRHMVLLGSGCAADAPQEEVDTARQLVTDGAKEILGEAYDERLVSVNSLEDYHNVKAIYGENWERLIALKKKYDPNNRLPGAVNLNK